MLYRSAFTVLTGRAKHAGSYKHTQVLAYFPKLVKKGHKGRAQYLPKFVSTYIMEQHAKHNVFRLKDDRHGVTSDEEESEEENFSAETLSNAEGSEEPTNAELAEGDEDDQE